MKHLRRRRDRKVLGLKDGLEVSPAYVKKVYAYKRTLEENRTPSERLFEKTVAHWLYRINAKWKAQYVFFIADQVSFIPDYYFPDFHLVIEIDGKSHGTHRGRSSDKWRDGIMGELGITTLRIPNGAMENPGAVFKSIVAVLRECRARPKVKAQMERCLANAVHREWYQELTGDVPEEIPTLNDQFRFMTEGI